MLARTLIRNPIGEAMTLLNLLAWPVLVGVGLWLGAQARKVPSSPWRRYFSDRLLRSWSWTFGAVGVGLLALDFVTLPLWQPTIVVLALLCGMIIVPAWWQEYHGGGGS